MITSIQKIIHWYYGFEHKKFKNSLTNVKKTQLNQLEGILNYLAPYNEKVAALIKNQNDVNEWGDSKEFLYHQFKSTFSTTRYGDWQSFVEEVKNLSKHPFRKICQRFEPTSGSTNAFKWIPYTEGFLAEINGAAATWLFDTFHQYPGVLKGKHYWSLSWVPPEMRQTHNSNDVDLFPLWQRFFLNHIMAVPDQVKKAKSQEACWFATLVYLVGCRELSLISIWSPTFLLQMINDLSQYKTLIISSLEKGKWAAHEEDLKSIPCLLQKEQAQLLKDFDSTNDREKYRVLKLIWPQLSLISSWDSSTAATWIPQIKKIFPHVPLQGKGLWATEGVVSVPYRGNKILALRSHFYEFRCLNSNQIFPCWELKKGMKVQPLLSSKNGFLRYELPDMMLVTDFINETPCFEFISRINSIDLVGEKIDFDMAQKLISETSQVFGVRGLCLIAEKNTSKKPHYSLLIEGDISSIAPLQTQIEDFLEEKLCNHYHYQLSRSLGQLNASEVLVVSDTIPFLKQFQKSSIGGGNKIEPIVIKHNFDI